MINAHDYFKDRFKLSVKEGKFCLFEHIDENPIFLNNFGMVSRLHRYLYNDREIPNKEFKMSKNPNSNLRDIHGNSKIIHMGPYGVQRLQ